MRSSRPSANRLDPSPRLTLRPAFQPREPQAWTSSTSPGARGPPIASAFGPRRPATLPVAGNFVVLSGAAAGEVLVIGITNDLSRARGAIRGKVDDLVYTRLNVARATREAEHADLAASYPEAQIVMS